MQEKVHRITSLIEKYLEEQLSQDEQRELNEWLAEAESNRVFFQQITDTEMLREKMKHYASADSEAMWQKTLQKIDGGKLITMYPQRSNFRRYVAAAAAAVVLISAGTWFYLGQRSQNQVAQTETTGAEQTAILPGASNATLTLATGKTITLNDTQNGSIATEGQTAITKTDGRLTYTTGPNSTIQQNTKIAYNTITTPRGGEYQITLPDGSKVTLNAASSLRFPIAFAGNERIVELTGEAYFEVNSVAKEMGSGKKPFIVKLNSGNGASSEVEVLGTHFNVMAYEDEVAIKTTLLEGSVKVVTGSATQTIKPGEQALLKKGEIKVQEVDAEDVIAWTNGFIPVGGADFEFTMRQIGRWYNVSIVYEGNVPDISFEGKLPRTASITDVMKVLNVNNVKARLDEKGRRIIITS